MKINLFLFSLILFLSGCGGGTDSSSGSDTKPENLPDVKEDTTIVDKQLRGLWVVKQDGNEVDSCGDQRYIEFSDNKITRYNYLADGCDDVRKQAQCYYQEESDWLSEQELGHFNHFYNVSVSYKISEDGNLFEGISKNSYSEAPLILDRSDKGRMSQVGTICSSIQQGAGGKDALSKMMTAAENGYSMYEFWCSNDYLNAVSLYSVRSHSILRLEEEYFSKKAGLVLSDYVLRVDSSTKGGFPITQNWIFSMEPGRSAYDSNWCISGIQSQ